MTAPGGGQLPAVSVVIPAFNAAATIGEALASIWAQETRPLEVLVVDDGSSDATAASAAAAGPPDGTCELRILRHEGGANRGVSASRNLALAAARSATVAFLDADDRLRPGSLSVRLEVLATQSEVVLAYGAVRTFGSTAERRRGFGVPGRPANMREWLLFENPIPTPSAVMARRAALGAPLFRENLRHQIEDWAAWAALAARGDFWYVESEVADYRVHGGSWSGGLAERELRLEQWVEGAALLVELAGTRVERKVVARALSYRAGIVGVEALGLLLRGRPAAARGAWRAATRIAGGHGRALAATARWAPLLKRHGLRRSDPSPLFRRLARVAEKRAIGCLPAERG